MGRAARRFCSKLRFVDDARSTICRGQRFFALNVICLFLPAGWAKRRQSFGKRFVRGGTTLFACCVDKLIDQPGVEDHEFLFAPIPATMPAAPLACDWYSAFQKLSRARFWETKNATLGISPDWTTQVRTQR